MNLEDRTTSIETIAALIANDTARAVWSVEGPQIFLRVTAGDKKWAIAAAAEPRRLGEDMCANYLLRKLAHAAAVCPRCIEPVIRLASDPKTNKTRVKQYRCAACMHSWTDS